MIYILRDFACSVSTSIVAHVVSALRVRPVLPRVKEETKHGETGDDAGGNLVDKEEVVTDCPTEKEEVTLSHMKM